MTTASARAAARVHDQTQLVFTTQKQRYEDCKYGQEAQLKAFKDQIHYDLVEVVYQDGMVCHIPAPFFLDFTVGFRTLLHLPHSTRVRDNAFFSCPICGAKSYFTGPCREHDDLEHPNILPLNQHLALEGYFQRQKRKENRKKFLRAALAHGRPIPKTVKRMEYVRAAPRWPM